MSFTHKAGPAPLLSWDFFAPQFHLISELLKDAQMLGQRAEYDQWENPIDFKEKLFPKDQVIVLTDPKLNIQHASANIYQMNGYMPQELIGKKPKIFQGEETCAKTSARISRAIKERKAFEETIVNYRKDGSLYRCWIQGEPVFNKEGRLIHFIAFEKEVA